MGTTYRYNTARPLVLADKMRELGQVFDCQSGRYTPFDQSKFAGATPVVLDDVSDWWDAHNPDEWPDPRLKSCARLPWERLWCEWHDKGDDGIYKGILMHEIAMPEGMTAIDFVRRAAEKVKAKTPQLPTEGWWQVAPYVCWAHSYCWHPSIPHVLSWPAVMFPVMEDGSVADNGEFLVIGETHGKEELAEATHRDLNVFRLFTALLRVKGSGLDDVALHPSRQARRRAERAAIRDGGPPPWIHYKTLTITLPGEKSAKGGTVGARGPGEPRPLHKVRAHLADYTKGKGMFGKYRILKWIKEHHRGYVRLGAIAKGYDTKIEETE